MAAVATLAMAAVRTVMALAAAMLVDAVWTFHIRPPGPAPSTQQEQRQQQRPWNAEEHEQHPRQQRPGQ
jgi:hypothetical protein